MSTATVNAPRWVDGESTIWVLRRAPNGRVDDPDPAVVVVVTDPDPSAEDPGDPDGPEDPPEPPEGEVDDDPDGPEDPPEPPEGEVDDDPDEPAGPDGPEDPPEPPEGEVDEPAVSVAVSTNAKASAMTRFTPNDRSATSTTWGVTVAGTVTRNVVLEKLTADAGTTTGPNHTFGVAGNEPRNTTWQDTRTGQVLGTTSSRRQPPEATGSAGGNIVVVDAGTVVVDDEAGDEVDGLVVGTGEVITVVAVPAVGPTGAVVAGDDPAPVDDPLGIAVVGGADVAGSETGELGTVVEDTAGVVVWDTPTGVDVTVDEWVGCDVVETPPASDGETTGGSPGTFAGPEGTSGGGGGVGGSDAGGADGCSTTSNTTAI